MATDVDQTFYGWSQDELSDRDDSQEASVSQMLDHGSISFGRFALESLSWERRSVFTHDRRQEELEKVNGLVARKKAYFEEYYKRLRALKALQQNQQTELTLDYGGDGSNSSQTGEDDETALQVGTLRDEAAETIDASSGETTDELTFTQDMNCNEDLQPRQLYPGSTTSDIDSLRKNIEKIELEKNSNRAVQNQDLETESLLSLTRSIEEIEQNGIHSVDDKEILREQKSSVSNVEHEPAAYGSVSEMTNSRASELQLASDHNLIPDKTKLAVEKSPDHKSVPEVKKELAASVRTGLELTHGTKREAVKSSRGAKQPGQKLIGKADRNSHRGKAIVSKVTSNYRAISVASHRSVTEVRSSITSSRPFSLSMERRSGISESAVRSNSKTSSIFASSQNRENGRSNVQGGSKKTVTTCSVKRRGLQNRRDCKEVIRNCLPSESQQTSQKGKDVHVLRQSKSSSNNLPARNKSNSDGGSGVLFTNTIRRNKPKEGKEDIRLKKPQGPTKKIVTPVTGNPGRGNKNAFPSGTSVQSNAGRKTQGNNLSPDGSKRKHETPLWR